MKSPRTVRVTPSLVISVLALLLALGSTSYAAGLARNSVGTLQLKNKAVTTAKLKDSAVTGAKVKNRSIGRADLAPGTVAGTTRSVLRTVPASGNSIKIAENAGVVVVGRCEDSGDSAMANIQLASSDGAGVTGGLISTRERGGDLQTFASSTGAFGPGAINFQAQSDPDFPGALNISGHLRAARGATVLVDIGVTAVGGTTSSCTFDVLLAPTG